MLLAFSLPSLQMHHEEELFVHFIRMMNFLEVDWFITCYAIAVVAM